MVKQVGGALNSKLVAVPSFIFPAGFLVQIKPIHYL